MKVYLLPIALFLIAGTKFTMGFAPHKTVSSSSSSLKMAYISSPPPVHHVTVLSTVDQVSQSQSPMMKGVKDHLSLTSSQLLSLEERRPPTQEEIAAKKRNFNLFFWGGGFVAPFLATFYYFGFKFWER
mmetsp:Transcript_1666/g.2458  ORF Transcript_1666/g.2458 Transcript_1666/m.2458 type:complete len:129 (-) Transcript_1666:155-541(-)|eukprot:CAMPEP_0194210962 /NCGR_PEP_ID=MMETSP0156-20130528/9208_1 /TAXON_ID=33649 /ORGANISM="Thalassionema nitzschioides, Strain L26-B" /LENGTH=128 /DNA_ID=CAMNT_0038938381 /DNA_START=73 /DNA_END=459 /DNA_ORIENTATION=+